MPAKLLSGLYGKLPAHGDFVARAIPVPVRRQLDAWLCRIANRRLPDGGLRGQLMIGAQMWLVLVLPSHDRSGRRFPLALLCPFEADDHKTAEEWCNAALAAYEQAAGQDADGLCAALPAAPASDAKDPAEDALWTAGQAPARPEVILAQLSSD